MERGSDKHGARLDDGLAAEVRGLEQGGHSTHAEEWKDAEPAGEDEPSVSLGGDAALVGGVPDGLAADDVERRSELARYLPRSAFPGLREQLMDAARGEQAPERVLDEVRRLPSGRVFGTVGEVYHLLFGAAESHRF